MTLSDSDIGSNYIVTWDIGISTGDRGNLMRYLVKLYRPSDMGYLHVLNLTGYRGITKQQRYATLAFL